jgi:L-2,4-diaminobutyrate decarboxylase
MAASSDTFAEAFSAETFRAQGHAVVDLLADHLARAQTPGAVPVLPSTPPDANLAAWTRDFGVAAPEGLMVLLQRMLDGATHVHSPRYVGHQVAAPLPAAALCHALVALTNNSTAVYEMSPVATVAEHAVVRWMAEALGYPASAGGLLTSGGSLGNLTALLAARRQRAGLDVTRRGLADGAMLAILTSEQAHYCVRRAAHIMGLGDAGTCLVPSDAAYRIDMRALEQAYEDAVARGLTVIAVVASACSTAMGAFDPLSDLADFCARRGTWLHVDAAHGGAACLSPRYRHLVAGIERADSVVWDAHKMLLVPSLTTGVLFKTGQHAAETFEQEASYLLGSDPHAEWFNMSHRTVECTRPALALPLYAMLNTYGSALFADHVTRCFDLARAFAAEIEASRDFGLACQPEANIVCFRYTGSDDSDADGDALQTRLRDTVNRSGAFHVVQTRARGRTYLRTTLIHPLTQLDDLRGLLTAVRQAHGSDTPSTEAVVRNLATLSPPRR